MYHICRLAFALTVHRGPDENTGVGPLKFAPHAARQSESGPDIVHFVGDLSPVVLSYLQPTAQALDKAGFLQHIVVVSVNQLEVERANFGSNTVVDCIASRSRLNRWAAGLSRLTELLAPLPPAGVHFHGFIPFCLGGVSMRREGYNGQVYYSPHGSRAHGMLGPLGSLAHSLVSPWLAGSSFLAIVDSAGDPAAGLPGSSNAVEPVSTPVDDDFFDTDHMEAPEAIIVGGSTEATDNEVNAFCQMAVMLPHNTQAGTPVRFFWAGPVLPAQEPVLKAAGIERVAPSDHIGRLELLSTAWLFLAPLPGRGYPLPLAEAMASGVPCVAANAPQHAALIRHGADGLLFIGAKQGMAQVVDLLEAADKRQAIGLAASARMQDTRSRSAFESRIVPLYKNSTPKQAPSNITAQ